MKSSPIGPYRDGYKFGDYRDLRLDPSSLRNPVAKPAVKAPSSSSRNVNTNTPKPENTNTPSEGNSNSGKGKGKGKEGSWWNNDYTKYALGAAGATGLGALGYGGYRLVSSD